MKVVNVLALWRISLSFVDPPTVAPPPQGLDAPKQTQENDASPEKEETTSKPDVSQEEPPPLLNPLVPQ